MNRPNQIILTLLLIFFRIILSVWNITDGGLSEISYFTSLGITGLPISAFICIVGILLYLSIAYVEYKKTKTKERKNNLKFWNYIKETAIFKRHKTITKERLSDEALDKIEQIIDENKEN